MASWLAAILPGRRLDFAFTDRVSGAAVNWYVDRAGRRYLAESRWALFRVYRPGPRASPAEEGKSDG